MKRREIEELKNKPEAELSRIITDNKEVLRVLSFELAAGKIKNISAMYKARKLIARAATFLKEKTKH